MSFTIHHLALPAADATELSAAGHAYLESSDRTELIVYGHPDFGSTPEAMLGELKPSPYWAHARWFALRDGADPEAPTGDDVLGRASVQAPLSEDTHLAYAYLWVDPEARGQGVGRALAREIQTYVESLGRTTVQVWRTGPILPPDAPHALVAKTGFGVVDTSAAEVGWMLRLGFELEQVERVSTLTLPQDPSEWEGRLAALRDEAAAAGYSVLQWEGRTPEDLREDVVALRRRMSVDIPSAGLESEEMNETVERSIHRDDRREDMGYGVLVAAVRHEASGRLVGYTELTWNRRRATGAWQEDTFVHGEHRGHRLGMLMKLANLVKLPHVAPTVERIHTWNADENGPMLAINEALGFEPAKYESAWQLRGAKAIAVP